jgi:uncharacterized protein (TIGR00299 family) protein
MFLASLIDSGVDEGRLERVLRETVLALGVAGLSIDISRDVERGIACTRVRVVEGPVRNLHHVGEMETVISGSQLPEQVRKSAIAAVRRLAEVEASIHGCSVDEIHFHEVGAVDTLVDVVGAFALVEALAPARIVVGTIPVGGGTVEIAHGRMGVPAPATARLLEGYRVVGGPEMRELTTPTGALIVSELRAEQGELPAMEIEAIGHGAGSMKLEKGPNVLRVMIGRETGAEVEGGEGLVELVTNLDDVSAEVTAYTARLLREAGALDVWAVPAVMKKDRAGVVLYTLGAREIEDELVSLIFAQTGTLGIRRRDVSRHVAQRGSREVEVLGRPIRVKWGRWGERVASLAAEYDDCASAASSLGIPLREVMEMAVSRARALLGDQIGR